jgi:hypothetical protein
MISSITTTVSTIVSSASVGELLSLGIATIITLIASLAIKELATGEGITAKLLNRNLDVVIIPLLFVFCFIVSVKIINIV